MAACTAPMITPRNPPSSKTCNPTIVVPPGEVTRPLSTAGCSLLSCISLAEPSTVCTVSCSAMGRRVSTILVRVDGAIDSSRVLTLPSGSTLEDALAEVTAKPEANIEAIQLFRPSVAARQKQMLEVSLRVLERSALTSRSLTSEEAALRGREAAQVLQFIDRARQVQPRGQVVLAGRESVMQTLLEDGDVLVVPERSTIVMVHGEVTHPTALAYDSRSTVADYVELAGGIIQRPGDARILLVRQDGTFVESTRARPMPGDEIIVVPTVGSRTLEVARGISQILFQIAVVARVALDL